MYRPAKFNRAAAVLSDIILTQAEELTAATGKGWRVVADAPETLSDVLAAWDAEGPFPIASAGLDGSIYGCAVTNAAFRYVHDSLHARYGYPFTLQGEEAAARHHLQEAAAVAARRGYNLWETTGALALLWCDTAGQARYHAETGGGFLSDQLGTVSRWYLSDYDAHVTASAVVQAHAAAFTGARF